MRLAVLLVGPRASEVADALDRHDRLETFAAASDGAARAYLSGTAFDRVIFLGPSDAVSLAESLGLDTLSMDADADAPDVLTALGLAPTASPGNAPTAPADGTDASGRGEAVRRIQALRAEIDRVAHDLNNPVAVILGNAQLAREMADADLDPTVAESLADIETAAADLAVRVRELGALRADADAALDALGHR